MKRTSVLFVTVFILMLLPIFVLADSDIKSDYTYYVISPEQIEDMGGWKFEQGDVSSSFRSSQEHFIP